MHEGPAGSSDQHIRLKLPADARKLVSTSSFEIYLSRHQKEIIIYPTVFRAEQCHIDAAGLEKLMQGVQVTDSFRESAGDLPAKAQLYERTANWEVYAAPDKVIIKLMEYHGGQLYLSFEDLRILRGISKPR